MIERIADGRTDLVFDYLAQVTPRNPLTRAASRSCSGERITGTSRDSFPGVSRSIAERSRAQTWISMARSSTGTGN